VVGVFVAGCGDGSGTNGSGANGAGANGSGANGSGANGSGANGSGANGSGASGSGGAGADGTGGAGNGASSGLGPPIASCHLFLADSPWNQDISGAPVHPSSDAYVDSIGRYDNTHPDFGTEYAGEPNGIPYVVVPGSQPKVPIEFDEADESDPGPYPVPPDAPIEGGPSSDGDRHVLVVDEGACVLYELYYAFPVSGGASWTAFSGAVWDLKINATRPDTWTSADAAGLPILPGLIRYDEVVERGVIEHALRFTAPSTQDGYISPATHYAGAGSDPDLPPMGLRMRLKASFDCGGLSSEAQVVCAALKKYGMFLADNGSPWYLSGAHDMRWDDEALSDLNDIPGDAFEAVDTGPIKTF
jgi:hypothetical protein